MFVLLFFFFEVIINIKTKKEVMRDIEFREQEAGSVAESGEREVGT